MSTLPGGRTDRTTEAWREVAWAPTDGGRMWTRSFDTRFRFNRRIRRMKRGMDRAMYQPVPVKGRKP